MKKYIVKVIYKSQTFFEIQDLVRFELPFLLTTLIKKFPIKEGYTIRLLKKTNYRERAEFTFTAHSPEEQIKIALEI